MPSQATTLVIFDCDGVLADSEVFSAKVLVRALSKYGVTLDTAYVYRHFIGRSFPTVTDEIRRMFSVDLPAEFEDLYRTLLVDAFTPGLVVTPGLVAMLANLGSFRCIATSSSPTRVGVTLELCNLASEFGKNVFTASQVKNGKPAPDLFLLAAETMGVTPDACLVIEDSLAGISAAQAAGMKVWRYVGGSHFAGFDKTDFKTPKGVPVFDNWNQFYQMGPELKARESKNG